MGNAILDIQRGNHKERVIGEDTMTINCPQPYEVGIILGIIAVQKERFSYFDGYNYQKAKRNKLH